MQNAGYLDMMGRLSGYVMLDVGAQNSEREREPRCFGGRQI